MLRSELRQDLRQNLRTKMTPGRAGGFGFGPVFTNVPVTTVGFMGLSDDRKGKDFFRNVEVKEKPVEIVEASVGVKKEDDPVKKPETEGKVEVSVEEYFSRLPEWARDAELYKLGLAILEELKKK